MNTEAIIFGLFGLIIGSFLNVLVLRRGVRSLGGRSSCMHCGTLIRWYDLVPVFSWIALRGRCRACKSRISFQYPFVEATTAILFAFVGAAHVPVLGIMLALPIIALLVVIGVYDVRHTIIPDEWVWAFNAIAFLSACIQYIGETYVFLWWGPLASAPLFLLWLVSRGRWMGFGDVKLALGIGWFLGPAGFIAVFGAFIIGTITLVPVLMYERVTHRGAYGDHARHLTMKSEVPFGPFLIVATLLVWFLGLYGTDVLKFFL